MCREVPLLRCFNHCHLIISHSMIIIIIVMFSNQSFIVSFNFLTIMMDNDEQPILAMDVILSKRTYSRNGYDITYTSYLNVPANRPRKMDDFDRRQKLLPLPGHVRGIYPARNDLQARHTSYLFRQPVAGQLSSVSCRHWSG